MRVLYVSSVQPDESPSPMEELAALEPALEIHVVSGAAAALVEVRTVGEYRAVFLSPQLPHNEALALIATLRRDRVPVAVVAIISETQREFFAPAFTAGADDVLVARDTGLITAEETLQRVRQSHHFDRPSGHPPLRVLYAGEDPQAWNLLADVPFIEVERIAATADGTCRTVMFDAKGLETPADLMVVDEQPGDGHALQVVKWVRTHAPHLPLIVLTSPTAGDIGGAALDLGAEDVVSKSGTYRRRLVATLHRHYIRREKSPSGPSGPSGPAEPEELVPDESAEIARIRAALAAETRIRELTAEVHALAGALDAERRGKAELVEAQAFERAMRDRDREELARLQQSTKEERERRVVLEGTLRQTENRSAARMEALEAQHAAARRGLEEQLATAADRLHQVANDTQALQTRVQNELTAQSAERDRFIQTQIFGYALVTPQGEMVRCNETYARMFGFESAADAMASASGAPLAVLADHAHVLSQLEAGVGLDRVESVVRRANGRPFRVLTSAAFRPGDDDGPALIERLFVDLDDRTRLEERLQLARRLEAAGRLAAEMSSEIEPLVSSITDPGADAGDRQRVATLVRQLLAFSRRQAKPAGLLSLPDAIRRAEPLLRQLAGDAVTFDVRVDDVSAVAAGEDDIESLLAALVFAAAASLPYGGTIELQARSVRSGFAEQTEIAVSAAGYGVHPAPVSSSLERLVSRCGGTVLVGDEAARTTTLHVLLPR